MFKQRFPEPDLSDRGLKNSKLFVLENFSDESPVKMSVI